MNARFLKFFLTGFALSALCFGLTACQTTSNSKPDEISEAEKPQSTDTESVASSFTPVDADSCPSIEILDGTGVLTAYAGDGAEKPQNILHQATFVKSSRQCSISEDALSITIGAAGRLAKGPKSVSDSATLPIRIVIMRGESEVLFTQLYNKLVSLQSDRPTEFSIKENNIRIPGSKKDNLENLKILIGFDTIGSDKIASDTDEKTQG